MTKVVINNCYGGFGLTEEAVTWLEKHNAFNTPYLQRVLKETKKWFKETGNELVYDDMELGRDNPILVKCVEKIGRKAFSSSLDDFFVYSSLIVVKHKGILNKDFFIGNYDGKEELFSSKKEAYIYTKQP